MLFPGAQRPHAPDVRIAVDAVPCAVEKNCEALLLLLRACKGRLVATFLRRTTNNHPDPDDRHDAKQEREPVCEPLDQSQNLQGAAPGCMASDLQGGLATLSENKPSADSVRVLWDDSKVLFGELAKLIGYGPGRSQHN